MKRKKAFLFFAVLLIAGSIYSSCRNPWMEEILAPFFKDKGDGFQFEYELGETGPGGGKVFYKSEEGFLNTYTGEACHYLETATEDMQNSGTQVFCWAAPGTDVYDNVPDTYTDIGTGRQNTAYILEAAMPLPETFAPAAVACRDYRGGGFSDWFLPSLDELSMLFNSDVIGNFGNNSYWSSSQSDDPTGVWTWNPNTKSESNMGKEGSFLVRPIRAF